MTLNLSIVMLSMFSYLVAFKTTMGEIQNKYSKQRLEFQNKMDTRRLIWTLQNVDSVIYCAKHCVTDDRCASYFYNRVRRECRGHSVTLSNVSYTVHDDGSRYYLFDGADGSIGDGCQQNSDCITPNAECRDGACWCEAGYSFSPRDRTCNHTCAQYGDDFTTVADHFIHLNNIEEFVGISLDQCKERCRQATNYTCRTVEFGRISLHCSLQGVTKLDVPSWWFEDVYYFEYSYYQRDCA